MPEQGPTREQIEAGLRVLVPMLTSCTECDTAEGQLCFDCREWSEAAIAAVLTATDHLTRARHVREAVEALSDERAVSIAMFIANHQPRPRGVAEAAALMRAALLDALTGEK